MRRPASRHGRDRRRGLPLTCCRREPSLLALGAATQRFYADRLGFEPGSRYPDYAICARDGVQVHFALTDDPEVPKQASCRIDVVGIEALYEEMSAAGVVHPNGPLQDQPWGFKEFAVLDGDGNCIKFGERTARSG